jgi:hypothetical protein
MTTSALPRPASPRRWACAALAATLALGVALTGGTASARPAGGPFIDPRPPIRTINLYNDPADQTAFTAWTLYDVGPTPYWISIWDHTSHTLIGWCGVGTSCHGHATWPEAANDFHEIVAYLGSYPVSDPPPTVVSTSNPVWIGTYLG